jgi:hypothetical protein
MLSDVLDFSHCWMLTLTVPHLGWLFDPCGGSRISTTGQRKEIQVEMLRQ